MNNISEVQFTREEEQIYSCLNLTSPKSFFLFAGAGSGKTHSLVQVLKKFRSENAQRLKLNGQKVGIITYTNAASDEIKRRLEFDSAFLVSTIHSFSWELVKPYQNDIKDWLTENLQKEIIEIEVEEKTGRAGTKASIERLAKIESKQRRLRSLESIKKFSYNPNGTNSGRDSLNHSEVLSIASSFLLNRNLMQQILIKKFPILLIDESQDTRKELIESLFAVQDKFSSSFTLGLFGDTMQRIYMDGKPDLGIGLPDAWVTPKKTINYRCPTRVVELINKIRSLVDGQIQTSYKELDGLVRLFLIDANSQIDKNNLEVKLAKKMADISSDEKWRNLREDVKCLTLEHHMAASRGNFSDFFEPLYRSTNDNTGLLDGSMNGISFLLKQVLPLIVAKKTNDEYAVANIIKMFSPLISKQTLSNAQSQVENIKKADLAIKELSALWGENFNEDPILLNVLQSISKNKLFVIPEILSIVIDGYAKDLGKDDANDKRDKLIEAWELSLKVPFSQLISYNEYISDKSAFGTHQGVKGLEFPRVMVILDDEEARGFLFSYEKLLGAKEMTDADKRNIKEGKETSIERTRRLFYVACSRAEQSLAIVVYSKSIGAIRNFVLSQDWFQKGEIIEHKEVES